MALYDSPIDDTTQPDLLAQDAALQRRKALLVAQAAQAAQRAGVYAPYKPDNEEVGGFTLSTGQRIPGRIVNAPLGQAAQALTPLVAQSRLASDQAAYDQSETGFRTAARADRDRRLAAMPTSTPAIPGHLDYTTGSDTPVAMTSGAPAREPSLRDRLEWAAGLKDNPLTAGVGDALTSDLIVKEPERVEARAERAQTRAEKIAEDRRKQREDIEFKRWQTEQNNQVRADIAQLVHGGGGSSSGGGGGSSSVALTDENGQPVEGWRRAGVKANDIVKDVATDGTVTLTDKLTGQRLTVGGGGRQSAGNEKDQNATRDAIDRSTSAINEAARAKVLLAQGSSSGLRADIRKVGSYVAPSIFGGKAQEADEALKPISDTYLKSVPRFEGPQSDADTKSYRDAAGQLANTNLPPHVRSAALDEVVRLHAKSLAQMQGRTAPAAPPRAPGAPLTVRDAVKAAAQPRSVDDLVNKYDRR